MNVHSGTFSSCSFWLICLFACFGATGCFIVKHAQPGKPFVFKNNIELTADISNGEKKSITRDLSTQLDDSLTPQVKDLLFLFHTYINPAVYDTTYAGNSLQVMKLYMNNQGFFSPEASYTYHIDTVRAKRKKKTQYRVTTTFYVNAGPRTLLDSIVTDLEIPAMQRLADSSKKSTLLVRNDPVSYGKIQGEMNRLIGIYKNYGYYALTQDAFQVTLDTTNPILINPTLDPLERIHAFETQVKKQKNPTSDLYIRLKPGLDSSLLKRFYIRRVFIYPDFETTRDNRKIPLTGVILDSVVLRYRTLKFKPSFLVRNNFLKPGDLYTQDNYNKTLNTFNYLDVWQVPIIQAREVKDTTGAAAKPDTTGRTRPGPGIDSARTDTARADSLLAAREDSANNSNETLLSGGVHSNDKTIGKMDPSYRGYVNMMRDSVGQLDFYYLLTPAKKQSFNTDFEVNYSANNSGLATIAGGDLFGTAVDLGLTNRNVGKEAINMTNTISGGLEVNPAYNWNLASVDLGYTNSFTIPRFVTPFAKINRMHPLAEQTVISSNATYVERIGYFDLNSFNFKYGFQWRTKPHVIWSYNPISVEYTYLYNETEPFDSALNANPFLKYAYANALIMAQNADLLYTYANPRHPNRTNAIRANLETSGLLSGIVKNSTNSRLFPLLKEYIRPSFEYKHEIKYRNNNSWDFRFFTGVGIPLGGDSTLPFFKQFVAGGPNSMRAWAFRSLGPGATHLAPYSSDIFNDRFGDIQMEANIEYRYNIAEIIPNSMYLKGAIFTDIGNIWDFRKQGPLPNTHPTYDSAHLDISHLYQELAMGAGVGFRLDFNYFILRFDFGFRFKKPDEEEADGWQLPNINIAHVFGRSLDNKEWRYNNYNFSFGIGYSF